MADIFNSFYYGIGYYRRLGFCINTFLNGEITTRFILKAFSIIVVAGVIFGYYLDDVKRSAPSKSAKYFAFASALVILILVVGAFFVVGSPMKARSMQFDQQRINDLQNIQYQVVNYWQRKEEIPNALTDLNDSISGYMAPTDPETHQSYEYNVKDSKNLSFELCAVFNLDSKIQSGIKPMPAYPVYDGINSQNWDHFSGHACFERIIDKQLYPPTDKPVK